MIETVTKQARQELNIQDVKYMMYLYKNCKEIAIKV